MSKATEKIMVSACGKAIVTGQKAFPGDVEYTRTDTISALIAQARRDALEGAIAAIEPHPKADVKTGGVLTIAQAAIRALIDEARAKGTDDE